MAMTAGQEPPPGEEPTFADVLHGLTFGGRRGRRSRRSRPAAESVVPLIPRQAARNDAAQAWPTEDPAPTAAIVRPYAWTRGRTRSTLPLELETLVSTMRPFTEQDGAPVEHLTIAELCTSPRSVAEVSALLAVPLGVAKVLISDMAEIGLLTVHQTAATAGSQAHFMLMERVLSGLRRL